MAPVKKRRDKKRARGKAVADDSDMNSTSHILGKLWIDLGLNWHKPLLAL